MKNEADVKKAAKKVLEDMDFWYFMPAMNGYGRAGIPDLIACKAGVFYAIEFKFGKNRLTALQMREMALLGYHGAVCLVINEQNVGDLRNILQRAIDENDYM